MIWRLVFFCFATCALNAASAPDSIAGTVLRDFGGIASLRVGWEHTIVFTDDGRYTFVKSSSASTLNLNWAISAPPEDGSYTYTKTSPSTGEVIFSDRNVNRAYWGPIAETQPSEAPARLTLDFAATSTLGGVMGGEFTHSTGGRGAFSLTRISVLNREPVPNISLRGIASSDRPLIVGFVLRGDARDVLIRVVGPSLRNFGISQPWENPRFDVYRGGSTAPIGGGPGPRRDAIAYYDDWSSDSTAIVGLRKLFTHVGAFPLELGSKDAVGVTPRMVEGNYTVVCTPLGAEGGGEALVEVYVLP